MMRRTFMTIWLPVDHTESAGRYGAVAFGAAPRAATDRARAKSAEGLTACVLVSVDGGLTWAEWDLYPAQGEEAEL